MKRTELPALIVDDDEDISSVLKRVLAHAGVLQVDVANSEKSALELIAEKKYSLMILDTFDDCPSFDKGPYGPRILKKARELGQNPKVVAMSASEDFKDFWTDKSTPDYFMKKPFSMYKVIEIVQKEFPE